MKSGAWQAWICLALVAFLVLGACASSEDCEFYDHCEGTTAVHCRDWTPGALLYPAGHVEREECDNNRKCIETDEAGPTSDHRIPVAECRYSDGSK